MPNMKRTVKDSVFTYLFSDPHYARELYLYLHPEDTGVTEEDCRLVTIQNILSDGQYNDLGLQIRDILLILAEAQSTFSPNLPVRVLLYLAKEYKTYIDEHKLRLYSTKAVSLPKAELYMIYSGNRADVPEVLRLSDLCGGVGGVEVTVKILRGGDSSIVGQYVEFCRIADGQRALYGPTKEAIQETIRICLKRDILAPFLTEKREEVVDIMEMLFSQEEIWELDRQEIAREARQEGRQEGRKEGIDLIGELMRRLEPLGRIGELIAATTDSNKLSALAKEFGLKS